MKWLSLLMVGCKAAIAFAFCLALVFVLLVTPPAKACDNGVLQLQQNVYAAPVVLQQVQPQYVQAVQVQRIVQPQYVVQQQVLRQRVVQQNVYAQPVILQQNVLKQRAQVVKSKTVVRSERSGIGRLLLGR